MSEPAYEMLFVDGPTRGGRTFFGPNAQAEAEQTAAELRELGVKAWVHLAPSCPWDDAPLVIGEGK